ncbi:MAG: diacylglycerol kinase family lipid kinase [Longimicrobiales bacterium]|nr:diacylglycerol kinase family lipid kinase [Longimicrobiales bacterium]
MDSLVVLNPDASGVKKNLTRVRGALADSPLLSAAEIETLPSWEGGRDAAARAAADGVGLVVAAGGDGTVNAVVNGLMSVDPPRPTLAVLPLGTGNDLARSLGLFDGWEDALEIFEEQNEEKMDVFRVELGSRRRYGANVSAGGFSGQVDESLTHEDKARWGPLAYLKTALENVTRVQSYDAVLVDEDGRERRMAVCNVVVGNGRWAAGGLPVTPQARMDDGLLDVVVLSSAPVARLGVVAARMAAGRHLEHELITTFRTGTLEIRSRPDMRFNVDGELLGAGTIRFEVEPGALPVLVGGGRDSEDRAL